MYTMYAYIGIVAVYIYIYMNVKIKLGDMDCHIIWLDVVIW